MRLRSIPLLVVLAAVGALLADQPSEKEIAAAKALGEEASGAVVYSAGGKIWKVRLGQTEPKDLGRGRFARFSPDGKRIVVQDKRKVYVMDADGGTRRLVVEDADVKHGCPIEFHPGGKRILYLRRGKGFHLVGLDGKDPRPMELGMRETGEPCLSADGKRLALRAGHSLYAVDLASGKHRKFARGCSPGVSPDGEWLMHNVGGHKAVAIESWDGKRKRKVDARHCRPDRSWDNHHWSNHRDYVAAQGDGKTHASYVLHLPSGRCTRVSWNGRTQYPDVWIAPD